MAMTRQLEVSQGKSVAELGRDALWFTLHTLLAVVILAAVLGAVTLSHPDPASASPKALASALALFVPLVFGFILARIWPASQLDGQLNDPRAEVARYVWIAGILFFAAVCVSVLDLPTGPGLCETCGAVEKLQRTFFSIDNGSGLMSGEGLLVGVWVPLSMFGYAAGAALGLAG
jgi:hypothetical protein